MSWRIAVRHRTGYQYATVVRAYNEARMTPTTSRALHTLESRLDVTPGSRPLHYVDYWGTVVDAFDAHVPHTELVVTALRPDGSIRQNGPSRPHSSVVETAGVAAEPPALGWDAVGAVDVADRYAVLLTPSRYVRFEPEVVAAAGAQFVAEFAPAEAGLQGVAWSHAHG